MKRIAFYMANAEIPEVDFSQPWEGNPGVGGTHFLFMTQPYYLQRYADVNGLEYEFYLLTNEVRNLPAGTRAYSVKSEKEAIEKAQELGVVSFVFRPMEDDVSTGRLRLYAESGIRLVGWAHNSYSRALLCALDREVGYKAHVCVCHEQLDELLDKRIYDKSTFIFNGFESSYAQPLSGEMRNEYDVVYIGSLIRAKGFHMLAEAWPEILRRVPQAKLKVIGSGQVYDRGVKLGQWGIAQKDYEQCFMPYLTDEKGEVLPSVEFLGLMGTEKFEVMKRAAVGVVNPTGLTENCPGSALEFQACGVPVVSAARRGLWDTVVDGGTGVLIKDVHGLVDAIVMLLNSKELNQRYGRDAPVFISNKFDYNHVCEEWVKLFDLVARDVSVVHIRPRFKFRIFKERRLLRLILRVVGKLGYWRK
jgi:glycosyltransferase involved in cell wall biosynthesis